MNIDFRVRAPFSHYAASSLYKNLEKVEKDTLARTDCHSPESAKAFSMDLLLKEADAAGIDKLVVPVRRVVGNGNEELARLLAQYPERLIGLAGIDIADMPGAFADVEKHVLNGPCKGIVLEPGQDRTPWQVNAAWAMPFYEFCQSHGVPVAFTYGGIMTRSLRYYDPLALDDVAGAFPRLKIALCHGGWPYVTECCQIAINRGNVWLAPDLYMVRSPGMADYFMAANHLLRHRVIFASAYPILPLKETVEAYKKHLAPDAVAPVLGGNALDFLNIGN